MQEQAEEDERVYERLVRGEEELQHLVLGGVEGGARGGRGIVPRGGVAVVVVVGEGGGGVWSHHQGKSPPELGGVAGQ